MVTMMRMVVMWRKGGGSWRWWQQLKVEGEGDFGFPTILFWNCYWVNFFKHLQNMWCFNRWVDYPKLVSHLLSEWLTNRTAKLMKIFEFLSRRWLLLQPGYGKGAKEGRTWRVFHWPNKTLDQRGTQRRYIL